MFAETRGDRLFLARLGLLVVVVAAAGCNGGGGGPVGDGTGGGGGDVTGAGGSGGRPSTRDAALGGRDDARATVDIDSSSAGGAAAVDAAAGFDAGPMADGSGAATEAGGADGGSPAGAVLWAVDNLKSIGGHATSVLGAPIIIDTPAGKAVQFDGNDDALFVENHPLAGLSEFTVEILFRPDPGGAGAQRFFHMQDSGSGGRVLFETRLPGGNSWVLDVFVESKADKVALYTPKFTHPLGAWYNVAAVIDGKRARHYVNGVEESSVNLGFQPHQGGRTSIGVRITKMYFFKGAIRLARFTPRVLTPAEFLKPE